MADQEKEVRWVGTALDDLRKFEIDARREAGYQLYRVQIGLLPDNLRPMPSVGQGVGEVRIRTGRQYRVFFLATYKEAVYVLHAFEKKSQKTRKSDIDIGRARLSIVHRSRVSGRE